MQVDSSEATAEFSHKLYAQLRYDDVWNNNRIAWYVKTSQILVNRAVIEKLWLLVHATQLLGILWINMCHALYNPMLAFPSNICFTESPHVCRCQGELRWPSEFCRQGWCRKTLRDCASCCRHALHSIVPALGRFGHPFVDNLGGDKLEQR